MNLKVDYKIVSVARVTLLCLANAFAVCVKASTPGCCGDSSGGGGKNAVLSGSGEGRVSFQPGGEIELSGAFLVKEIKLKRIPGGIIDWFANSDGTEDDPKSVQANLNGFLGCYSFNAFGQAGWCEPAGSGGGSTPPECCYDDSCTNGEDCTPGGDPGCDNTKGGNDQGSVKVFSDTDASNNAGESSGSEASHSGAGTSGGAAVPDQLSGDISMGRSSDGAEAGTVTGHLSFNFSLGGGSPTLPSLDALSFNISNQDGIQSNDTLFSSGLGLRQVLSDDSLIHAEQLSNGVSIKCFPPENLTMPTNPEDPIDPGITQPLSTTVVTTSSIVRGGQTFMGLRSVLSKPGERDKVYEVYAQPDPEGEGEGTWIEVQENLVTERVLTAWSEEPDQVRSETVTEYARDADTQELFPLITRTDVYRRLVQSEESFLERLVTSTQGTGNDSRTTYYFYEENANLWTHGKLLVQINPDGSWIRNIYRQVTLGASGYDVSDSKKLLVAIYSGWLDLAQLPPVGPTTNLNELRDAVLAVPVTACRAEYISYLTLPERILKQTFVQGALTKTSQETNFTVIDPFSGRRVNERRIVEYAGSGEIVSDTRTATQLGDFYQTGSGHNPDNDLMPLGLLWETTVYEIQSNGTRVTYHEEVTGTGAEFLKTRYATHGTLTSPAGIPRQTLREVTVSNYERVLSREIQVYLGGDSYAPLSKETYEKTEEAGAIVERTFRNGVEVSTVRHLASGAQETTDAAGLKFTSLTDPETQTSTTTEHGGAPVVHNGSTLFSGTDLVRVTTRHKRPGNPIPEGYLERTVTTANGVSRTESEIEYDAHGRVRKQTNAQGAVVTINFSKQANGTESMTETLPGNLTRITSYYADGSLKSVTGSAVVPEYHTYEVAPGSLIKHTRSIGPLGSPRKTMRYTDGGGRVIREEIPGPGVGNLIVSESRYNALGHLTRISRSGGQAAQLSEYGPTGELVRQGLDMDGNGKLEIASADRLTESSSYYEQNAGLWWQVRRTRVYEGSDAGAFRQSLERSLQNGTDEVSETTGPGEIKMISTTVIDRANRKRTLKIQRSDRTQIEEQVIIGGLPFFKTRPNSSSQQDVTSYSDFREPVKTTLWGGYKTYAYDATGLLQSETEYSAEMPTRGISRTTTYSYIPSNLANAGQLAAKDAPYSPLATGTSSTFYAYDNQGRLTGQWGPGTYPVRYGYNAYGDRETMTTYRSQTIASITPPWDESVSPALVSVTAWQFDPGSGLLTAKTDADQKTVIYQYHPGTRQMASRTWARQHQGQPLVTNYGYNPAGQLQSISYSDGSTPAVAYTYRRDGALSTVTDAGGLRTFSDWSPQGIAQREVVQPASGSASLLEGLQRTFPRDSQGRRTGYGGQWSAAGVKLMLPPAAWAYDSAYGHWNQVSSGQMQISWTLETVFTGRRYTRQWVSGSQPAFDSIIQSSLAAGTFYTAHYQPYTTFKQSRARGSSSDSASVYSMTDHDQIHRYDPNHGQFPPPQIPLTINKYTVDTRGQVTSSRTRFSPSVSFYLPGWDYSYSYDDIGNRLSAGTGSAAQPDLSDLEMASYSTNALNQYVSIARPDSVHITGNAAGPVTVNGQSTSRTGSWNEFFHKRLESGRTDLGLPAWLEVEVEGSQGTPPTVAGRAGHLYLPPIPEAPAYDADGNLTADSRWSYVWDGENRLVQMTATPMAVLAGAPNLRLSFVYDYWSRRIGKKVERYAPATSTWELTSDLRFVYDGWNVIAEIQMKGDAADAPNTSGRAYLVRSYFWGPDITGTEAGAGGVGGLLAMTRHARQGRGAESYWATWDLNGNVIGLAHTNDPSRMAVYDYDAFGQSIRVTEPEENLNPVRFSSKYTDEETGLVYYGYRYYSPEMGRWISRDPIEEEGGFNLYGMLDNEPVNRVDYLGLKTEIDNEILAYANNWQFGSVRMDDVEKNGNNIPPFSIDSKRLDLDTDPKQINDFLMKKSLGLCNCSNINKLDVDEYVTVKTEHAWSLGQISVRVKGTLSAVSFSMKGFQWKFSGTVEPQNETFDFFPLSNERGASGEIANFGGFVLQEGLHALAKFDIEFTGPVKLNILPRSNKCPGMK